MDLFDLQGRDTEYRIADAPLAWRMRPRSLQEFVGQRHILDKGKLLWRIIKADRLTSLIFFGPSGCGKTALAQVIAKETNSSFHHLNAVTAGVSDLKIVREESAVLRRKNKRTILFLDEIHRFNRAQQDVLLPMVESGMVALIGASTHNPFFAIIPPLASRSTLIRFDPLSEEDLEKIMDSALQNEERGLGRSNVIIDPAARKILTDYAGGDARKLLNALEIAVLSTKTEKRRCHITPSIVQESTGKHGLAYDRDDHYDTVSAFIKSMRGSDPDASLFWLAKMIEAGEDPLFVARRIAICAAEDVGLAEPMALVVAQAAFEAVNHIGMPEGRIPLAQAAVYIACAPKSNAAYLGISKALKDIRAGIDHTVPPHLRDTSYSGADKLSHGLGYKYPHDYPGHYIEQEYMPNPKRYYYPSDMGLEVKLKERLASLENEGQKKTDT